MTLDEALSELQNPDPKARVHAIRWLRVCGGPKAVDALIGALDDPDDDVHLMALVSLEEMRAGEAVPVLIERLKSVHHPAWKPTYILALKEMGDRRAIPALIAALDDPNERVVAAVCEALASFDEWGAVEPLLRLLENPRWRVRKAACKALFDLKVTDDRLVAALERLSQEAPPPSPDWEKRAQEAGADSPEQPLLATLAAFAHASELLTGETEAEQFQRGFREMLEELAQRRAGSNDGDSGSLDEEEDPPGALEAALAQVQDPDPEQRWAALSRLNRLAAPEAAAAVVRALDDPVARVRSMAVLELGRAEPSEYVPVLIRHLLEDESAHVRKTCARVLGYHEGEPVSEALRRALFDPDQEVVWNAAIALRNRGDRQAIPLLLTLLEHEDRRNRLCASEVLLELHVADQRLVETLEKLARDPEAEEYDLEVGEWNSNLDRWREHSAVTGGPEPGPRLTMVEMVEQARRLLHESGCVHGE
jgi:HEAT repeat protein